MCNGGPASGKTRWGFGGAESSLQKGTPLFPRVKRREWNQRPSDRALKPKQGGKEVRIFNSRMCTSIADCKMGFVVMGVDGKRQSKEVGLKELRRRIKTILASGFPLGESKGEYSRTSQKRLLETNSVKAMEAF